MKVLLLNQYFGFGSTGKIVQDIYKMLVEDDHKCCIAYGRNTGHDTSEFETYKIGNKVDTYEHVFETRFSDNHGFSSRGATKKFIKFIEQYNPDVIHIHNLHGYYINIKILMNYLRNKKMKIIWTFHDCWNFSAHAGYIDYDSNGKLQTKVIDKKELSEYPKAYFSLFDNYSRKKKLFSGFEDMTIITPSRWLSNMTADSFFDEYKIETIYNGIDTTKFYKDKATTLIENKVSLEKEIILGVASVWDDRKGLIYFNELDNIINHDRQKIVVIGKIESDILLNNDILHIAQTENIDEMRQWYSNASFFVNPTLYDNFPTTNLEAIACGTPVITFDTGGSPESVELTNFGKVVPKGDMDEVLFHINNSKDKFQKNDFIFDKNIQYKEYYQYYGKQN